MLPLHLPAMNPRAEGLGVVISRCRAARLRTLESNQVPPGYEPSVLPMH